jgi:uncharacterized protein YjbI with pentapeptide repeats
VSADLREAIVTKAVLVEAKLFIANLIGANVSGANLTGADLRGADLSNADLSGASLREADLRGAKFNEARLTNANLIEAKLAGAGLMGARLDGAMLTSADLHSADLSDANLSGAMLIGATFHVANLSKADLSGVNLSRADLTGADLCEANLCGAELTKTVLIRAKLSRTDLRSIQCAGTIFADVDLSEARGLKSVAHRGPSTLGIDTLLRSKGKIPEAFLHGCGVPDDLMQHLLSVMGSISPTQLCTCFISYSSGDRGFAERLRADLQAEGVRCWFDKDNLKSGDVIRQEIADAISVYDKVVLVLSEESISSKWVGAEAEAALEREGRENVSILVPIRLDDTVLETKIGWASHLRQTRQIGDFRGWKSDDQYKSAFARLLNDLKEEVSTGHASPTSPVTPPETPR